jgi:hypothetical protein
MKIKAITIFVLLASICSCKTSKTKCDAYGKVDVKKESASI